MRVNLPAWFPFSRGEHGDRAVQAAEATLPEDAQVQRLLPEDQQGPGARLGPRAMARPRRSEARDNGAAAVTRANCGRSSVGPTRTRQRASKSPLTFTSSSGVISPLPSAPRRRVADEGRLTRRGAPWTCAPGTVGSIWPLAAVYSNLTLPAGFGAAVAAAV